MSEALPPVLARMKSLGFHVCDGGAYDLNFFGIRSKNRKSDSFDDLLGCAYREADGAGWTIDYWTATTDPGRYYLENPANPAGTAIMAPGQYRGAYAIGKHRGKYDCLRQVKPVRIFRDDNRDDVLDFDNPTQGVFGLNIHASRQDAHGDAVSTKVGRWSAGCQVHATQRGFNEMMDLARLQIKHHPKWTTFTYTLLDQWW